MLSVLPNDTPSLKEDPKFASLWNMVGNTPMVEIRYSFQGTIRTIFAKCEYYNLTGSIKDRMALYILQEAYYYGTIMAGDTIVEATSGNTGIALAAIGRWLGHSVLIIMPDWLSPERTAIIRSLGAEVMTVSRQQGGFQYSIKLSEAMAKKDRTIFLPRQFSNMHNAEIHERTTGQEIALQLAAKNKAADAFVAGVGTGGTIMGVGRCLKRQNKKVKIHPLEPAESPTLSTGYKSGTHRIQGISDEFIPPLLKLKELDDIVSIHDGDAIRAAQMLASRLGLAVGISSGANFLGAVQIQNKMGHDANVVTVFCDSNKKYLSTDLVKVEPQRYDYLSTHIRLLDYRCIGRLSPTIL